jgi:tetratricopeptide (TPR) repeat protein
LGLVERLDTARIVAGTLGAEKSEPAKSDPLYASAFAEAGLGRDGDDVETVAAYVRNSAVRAEIVAALDDWASVTPNPSRRAWLLAVARTSDSDPTRDRLRQPELWQERIKLTRLAQELSAAEVSPQLATALGRVARASGGGAVPLLIVAQARFPQDFWLNFELGCELYEAKRSDEAIGYNLAALAIRPQASGAHNNLGVALCATGRWDEAIEHYRQALRTDPESAVAHSNLGLALWAKGRQDEAIRHYQEAIRLDPKGTFSHNNLGLAMWAKGRLDEAISHYHNSLGLALWAKGRQDEAIRHYQEAIRLDPKGAVLHYNLGLALRDKGRLDEAIDQFRQAIELELTLTVAPPILASTLLQAARADVEAAAGQGSKTGQLSESDRSDKRRQALARLRPTWS